MSNDVTKEELYERATELDISGRSSMNKDELAAAIAEADTEARDEEPLPSAPVESGAKPLSNEEQAEQARRAAVREDNERRQKKLGRR